MTTKSYERLNCPIARSLSVLGDQWTLLILRDALFGLTRFEEFQSSLGLSRNLLSRRLGAMVDDGLLERRPISPGARRQEYQPTEKARDLLPVLLALGHWRERWEPSPDGPRIVPVDPASGKPVALRLVPGDEARGVSPRDVVLRPGPGADDRLRRRLLGSDEADASA